MLNQNNRVPEVHNSEDWNGPPRVNKKPWVWADSTKYRPYTMRFTRLHSVTEKCWPRTQNPWDKSLTLTRSADSTATKGERTLLPGYSVQCRNTLAIMGWGKDNCLFVLSGCLVFGNLTKTNSSNKQKMNMQRILYYHLSNGSMSEVSSPLVN